MKNNKNGSNVKKVFHVAGTDQINHQEKQDPKKDRENVSVLREARFNIPRRYSYNNNRGGYAGL